MKIVLSETNRYFYDFDELVKNEILNNYDSYISYSSFFEIIIDYIIKAVNNVNKYNNFILIGIDKSSTESFYIIKDLKKPNFEYKYIINFNIKYSFIDGKINNMDIENESFYLNLVLNQNDFKFVLKDAILNNSFIKDSIPVHIVPRGNRSYGFYNNYDVHFSFPNVYRELNSNDELIKFNSFCEDFNESMYRFKNSIIDSLANIIPQYDGIIHGCSILKNIKFSFIEGTLYYKLPISDLEYNIGFKIKDSVFAELEKNIITNVENYFNNTIFNLEGYLQEKTSEEKYKILLKEYPKIKVYYSISNSGGFELEQGKLFSDLWLEKSKERVNDL